MADERLTSGWRFEAEVLSPLHVGAGGPRLLYDYDFLASRGEVWVLDAERAYAQLSDERLAGEEVTRLSQAVGREQYAACARYRLAARGGETPREIVPCARTVFDRPYLPGSTLKGAIRTAVLYALLRDPAAGFDRGGLTRMGRAPGVTLERRWLMAERGDGANRDLPNRDLLRAVRVADADVTGEVEAELTTMTVYSLRNGRLEAKRPESQGGRADGDYRWFVEALPTGTRVHGTIGFAEDLFRLRDDQFPYAAYGEWLRQFPWLCRQFAYEVADYEAEFYRWAGLPGIAGWYDRLRDAISSAGTEEFFVQIGWGTGWLTKTIGLLIVDDDEALHALVEQFRLDRGRGAAQFPKTRRLVERGNVPESPPGWMRVRLTPV